LKDVAVVKANATRIRSIIALNQQSEHLVQKRNGLIKDFATPCKDNTEEVKRYHKGRLKSHRARVASRVAAESVDSDPESDDTQATLLREIDVTETRLRKTNEELKDADEHVVS
jgi:hypothetical protein